MPPPVNQAQPSSKWTGTYFDSGAWACQISCSWPKELRAAHEGRATENVRLFNFATQAEAAAAFDLLTIWRQSQRGKPLTGKQYNLGLQRYKEHVAAMVACKSLQEAREHVRQLKDSGVVAALAACTTSPSAEGGAAVLASADDDAGSEQPGSKRKRASPGVAAAEEEGEKEAGSGAEKNAEGEEREEGSSGGSEEEQELSSSSEASGDDEEDVLRVEPVPKRARGGMPGHGRGRGAAAPPPGVPKAARGGGRAGFHSVVASPPGWACQVLISHSKLAQKYREEVSSPTGKTNIRVTGFGSPAEAAAAADLALLWRCRAYDSDIVEQEATLNFQSVGYTTEPGAGMLARVVACANAEAAKVAVRQMRDEQLLAQLAATLERNPDDAAIAPAARAARGTPGGRGGRGSPGGRGRGRGGRGGRGVGGGRGGRGGRRIAALAAAAAEEEKREEGEEQEQQPAVRQPAGASANAGAAGSDDDDLEDAAEGRKASRSSEGRRYGAEVVGRRLQVYWPVERRWFPGVVAAYRPEEKLHLIEYDDGDTQHLHLAVEQVRWLRGPSGRQAPAAAAGAQREPTPAPAAGRHATLAPAPHPGSPGQHGTPGVARTATAAAQPAPAGPPPDAAELLQQLRAVRKSGEEMAVELEAALRRTPGLKEWQIAAFLGRFAALRDVMRVTHFQLMRYTQAGQHELVCAYVSGLIAG